MNEQHNKTKIWFAKCVLVFVLDNAQLYSYIEIDLVITITQI